MRAPRLPREPVCADLHTHTTASDGELSPEALVDAAAAAGLQALALTDHDTQAGVARARARGAERGVEVIAGCEMTAYRGSIELHVLALFAEPDPAAPLGRLLARVRARRRERGLEMAARLRRAGLPLEDADVLEAAAGADAVGKPHVAAALVKRGLARTVREALMRHLSSGAPGDVPKERLAPEDVIAAIHGAGGVAALAHPGLQPHDELIPQLCRQGLDALEAFHRSHSEVNRRYYAGLARRYEVGVTGGSDFHGPRLKPGLLVGASGVGRAELEFLRRRAAERASPAASRAV